MNESKLRMRGVAAFLAFCAVIILSYYFADRQVAEASRNLVGGGSVFKWMTYLVMPLTPAASLGLAAIAVSSAGRRTLTEMESDIIRLCCAVLVAGVVTFELKSAFGRTWPDTWVNNNPSYFGNGVYGFFPFHGGAGYSSFPSGHTTAASAIAVGLWFLYPALRWFGVALLFAVAVGLVGMNYHWLSDVEAGAVVGGTCGWVAARIGRGGEEHPRQMRGSGGEVKMQDHIG